MSQSMEASPELERLTRALAIKLLQYEADHENIDWPEDKCAAILDQLGGKHSGDCVKMPWTCDVCLAEDATRFAAAAAPVVLAALNRPR